MRASFRDAVDGRLWAGHLRPPIEIERRLDHEPIVLPLPIQRLVLGPAREELNLCGLHLGVRFVHVDRQWLRLACLNSLTTSGPLVP